MIRRVKHRGTVIEYDLRQTGRRSLECRVAPGQVTVFTPLGFPLREADAYVLRQGDWILQALSRSRARAEAALERNAQAMQEGAPIPVEGKEYALRLLPGEKPAIRLEGERIVVCGAGEDPLEIRAAIRDFLIHRAKERIGGRIKHYAEKIGVAPGGITLREQKTKWGSCSSLGNLNFNWKLIMAPPEALDYVVVHELCHLLEMNHSPAFWAHVEKHCPDYKKWRDHLKNGIKSPFE